MTGPGSAGVGESLAGGNSNAPVRFGDRVHRTAGPWSPTIHAYLRHLRAHGVDLVPEPFGFDGEGREVLAFLPGTVPTYPLADAVWTDAFLAQAARVLRRIHDASTGFDPVEPVWQQPAREPCEVVSVNDYAPYNLVVDGDRIRGVIDLDQASPGPRSRDLAHLAYRLVPLTAPGNRDGRPATPAARGGRLRILIDSYGAVASGALTPREVLDAVGPLLSDLAQHADNAGRRAHADLYRADADHLPSISRELIGAAD